MALSENRGLRTLVEPREQSKGEEYEEGRCIDGEIDHCGGLCEGEKHYVRVPHHYQLAPRLIITNEG